MTIPRFLRVDTAVGYRWYTVGWGRDRILRDRGRCREDVQWWLKIGPLSLCGYVWDGPQWVLTFLTHVLFDTGIRAHR